MAPKSLSKASKEKDEQKEQSHPPPVETKDDNDTEDETEEEETDDDVEETDEEQEQQPIKSPIPPPKPVIGQTSGSDSGSDSESDSNGSGYKMEPVVKPVPTVTSAKRPLNEVSNTNTSSKTSKKSKTESKEAKFAPLTPVTPGVAGKTWSNEDEINVLRGLSDYKDLKGKDPCSELSAFHEYMKGKFLGDYSKEQLRSKVKNMKNKYTNAVKRTENGSEPIFQKAHDAVVFELSKKLWKDSAGGSGTVANGTPTTDVSNGKKDSSSKKEAGVVKKDASTKDTSITAKKDSKKAKREIAISSVPKDDGATKIEESFWSKYPFLTASFDEDLSNCASSMGLSDAGIRLVKDNLSLIGSEKAKNLNTEWKQLLLERMELTYKMSSLVREQVQIVFNLMNHQ